MININHNFIMYINRLFGINLHNLLHLGYLKGSFWRPGQMGVPVMTGTPNKVSTGVEGGLTEFWLAKPRLAISRPIYFSRAKAVSDVYFAYEVVLHKTMYFFVLIYHSPFGLIMGCWVSLDRSHRSERTEFPLPARF
jgi:hypothetical protein